MGRPSKAISPEVYERYGVEIGEFDSHNLLIKLAEVSKGKAMRS